MHIDITSTEIHCSNLKSQYIIESTQVKDNNGDLCHQVVALNVKSKHIEQELSVDEKIDVFVEAVSALLKSGNKIEIIYPN
jgi:hypothetical protein